MDQVISGIIGSLAGAVAAYIFTFIQTNKNERVAKASYRSAKSVDLNLEMHKEFISLMDSRIRVWKEYQSGQISANDDSYPSFWHIGNFYIRLAYLLENGHLDAKEAGKLHGQNAWWWHFHFFTNVRVHGLKEKNEIKRAARAWELMQAAASKEDLDVWEPDAKSYD